MTPLLGLAILFLVLVIGGALLFRQPGDSTQPQWPAPEQVTVGLALQPTNALMMVALEQGYFADEGLEATIVEYPSGKRALREGLFPGAVEVATASDVPVALAALDGRRFRIVAGVFQANNVNRVIARRDAGIAQPGDLRGKRIGVQRASAVHFFLHLFLLEQGLAEHDVVLRFMKAESLPRALAAGEIDAFSMREPYISQARALLGEQAVVFGEPGLYNQVDLVVVNDALTTERPSAVPRLLRALLKAEAFARADPWRAIAITARRLGVPEADIEALWPTVRLGVSLEQSLLLLLEGEARWALGQGLSTAVGVPNYLEYIQSGDLHALKPQAVAIVR